MTLRSTHLIGAALGVLVAAGVSSAQGVRIEFKDGLVTLSAQQAPLRVVLAEWARLGGTTIVGREQVAGAPMTLELTGVTERQALEILLRDVPGFMLAAREDVTTGVSRFDRIMLLPTTTAPRTAPAATFSSAPPPPFANNNSNAPEQEGFVNRAAEEAERRAEELAQRVREASEAMGRLMNQQPANQQNRGVITPAVTARPGAPAPFDDPPRTPAATPSPAGPPVPNNPFMPTPVPPQQPERK